MPCLAAPTLPVPQLPSPLHLALPDLGLPTFDLTLCCTITPPPIDLPYPASLLTAPPPGPTINLTVINVFLSGVVAPINEFLDTLQLDCPVE